ncbi:MAG: hypothetical protein KDJ38_05025 [Gammaproteobacteria bacterium]|nr:hypothetical protein [Gammaproteobacteria bacterium]
MKTTGVIMLNTRFPRLVGDIGNPASFRGKVDYVKLEKSRVGNIVGPTIAMDLVEEILQAAIGLESRGAGLITTSCGFLGPVQSRVQARLGVPFIASSLALIPLLRTLHGGDSAIGVLTFDSRKLTPEHFCGNHSRQLAVAGIENGRELHRVISNDEEALNPVLALADVLQAADALTTNHPDLRCLLLECTNLSPYKPSLRKRSGLPVYDLVDTLNWLAGA